MRESEDVRHSFPKAVIQQEIRLIRENGEMLHAQSESLLNGGLAIQLWKPLLSGEQVRLEALLPNHESHRLEPVAMTCRVSYLLELTHPPGALRAGLSITEIGEQDRQRLLRYAREHLRRFRAGMRQERVQSDSHDQYQA
ncbi:MAG: hypothetical protein LAT50_04540 [Ectothiorhodospiraceae bacterium]|nr:hypothetical protein [Ectothiorhodospiraceae bacterium]